jgi:hypothetical protein
MLKDPQTENDLRMWLNRRELMASISRLRTCQYGHDDCSTHEGGPCHAELLDKLNDLARDRALELVAQKNSQAAVTYLINREYPALGYDTLALIVDEAFGLTTRQ